MTGDPCDDWPINAVWRDYWNATLRTCGRCYRIIINGIGCPDCGDRRKEGL